MHRQSKQQLHMIDQREEPLTTSELQRLMKHMLSESEVNTPQSGHIWQETKSLRLLWHMAFK
jgi:hypothetical protein